MHLLLNELKHCTVSKVWTYLLDYYSVPVDCFTNLKNEQDDCSTLSRCYRAVAFFSLTNLRGRASDNCLWLCLSTVASLMTMSSQDVVEHNMLYLAHQSRRQTRRTQRENQNSQNERQIQKSAFLSLLEALRGWLCHEGKQRGCLMQWYAYFTLGSNHCTAASRIL